MSSVIEEGDYRFVAAVPNDASQMKRLNEACLPENYPYRFWFDLVSMNPGRSFVCRSVSERKMIGYALFGADSKAQLRLISVAVLPGHRGRGVAARLIQLGLATLGASSCLLDVRVGNELAIRLYERLGFRKLRIFPGYYANKEDAWSMIWGAASAEEATGETASAEEAVVSGASADKANANATESESPDASVSPTQLPVA